jgi:hypothetical protein
MPIPHEGAPDDREFQDAASVDPRLEEASRVTKRLREVVAESRMQSVAMFDQFVAELRDLEHSMDTMASLDLPSGPRLELVKATSNVMKSAILGLHYDAPDVHDTVVDEIEELLCYARRKRLANRARSLIDELGPDEDQETFDAVVNDSWLLDQLADEAGLNPSDATIRAWLVRNHAKRSGRRKRGTPPGRER